MTHVTTPNTGAFPQRKRSLGSMIGAVALVVAAGAAIATGVAMTSDDTTSVQPITNTFTQVREQGPSAALNNAAASDRAILEDLVNRGLIPAQALESAGSSDFANKSGPR